MKKSSDYTVKPGVHHVASRIIKDSYSDVEKRIVSDLSKQWYISRAGTCRIAKSTYKYLLMRPSQAIAGMFNITYEVICILNDYPTCEARTLTAFDEIKRAVGEQRLENLCGFLIGKDKHIEDLV